MEAQHSPTAPIGWYDDPTRPGAGQQRFWDGSSWTAEVRNGEAGVHLPETHKLLFSRPEFYTESPLIRVSPSQVLLAKQDGSGIYGTSLSIRDTRRSVTLTTSDGEELVTAKRATRTGKDLLTKRVRRQVLIDDGQSELGLAVYREANLCSGQLTYATGSETGEDLLGQIKIRYLDTAVSPKGTTIYHDAKLDGQISFDPRVSTPVMSLAIYCTLSRRWFHKKTGQWTSRRSEPRML